MTERAAVTLADLKADYQQVRRRARLAVREFVAGAVTADFRRMAATFELLDYGYHDGGGWDRAMRAIAGLGSVPAETREWFLNVHLRSGDHIRQETHNDLSLVDGYRVLLPPYTGPAIILYRGEGARNRRRRTYGMSWTSSRDVAESYAQHPFCRSSENGSVVLETFAAREAIICAVSAESDRYGEQEYLIDRRMLGRVKVLTRYSHRDPSLRLMG